MVLVVLLPGLDALFSSEVQSRGQGWDCNMSPFSKTQRSSGPVNSGTALQTSLSADFKEHDAPGEGLWTVFPEDSYRALRF